MNTHATHESHSSTWTHKHSKPRSKVEGGNAMRQGGGGGGGEVSGGGNSPPMIFCFACQLSGQSWP